MANSLVKLATGEILIDLTQDTVTKDKLLSGSVAHGADGSIINGELTFINVYSGSGEPSATLGNDGDIYLDLG